MNFFQVSVFGSFHTVPWVSVHIDIYIRKKKSVKSNRYVATFPIGHIFFILRVNAFRATIWKK